MYPYLIILPLLVFFNVIIEVFVQVDSRKLMMH